MRIFISNVSMHFPGENRFHGIYRVLWLWDDGRFSLLHNSLEIDGNINVIAPPHPTQTPNHDVTLA